MICPACSAENLEHSHFCSSCGSSFSPAAPPPPPPPPTEATRVTFDRRYIWAALAALLLVAGAFAPAVYQPLGDAISIMAGGNGDGPVILLTAVAVVVLLTLRRWRLLALPALVVGGLSGYSFAMTYASGALLGYAWLLLLAGVVLLLALALIKPATPREMQVSRQWWLAPTIVVLSLVGLSVDSGNLGTVRYRN